MTKSKTLHNPIIFQKYIALGGTVKLGYAILGFFILAVAIIIYAGSDRRTSRASEKPMGPTVLYSHDSQDEAAGVYYPGIRGSATVPFPIGKREEREKTETYQNRSK